LGCEIGPSGNVNFGVSTGRSPAPGLAREYNIESTVGVQHQLLPRVFNLIPPGTKYEPRWNQLDLSFKKTFRLAGGRQVQGQAAVFNVLNGNTVLQEIQSYGPSLGQPQVVLQARLLRLAVLIDF
jgi:hypothetical protein